jgi:glycosyltransferase involved in cell wall biosynthesis
VDRTVRDIGRGELRAPAWVVDIDIARAYGDEAVDVARFATAWCLVRRNGLPLATRFLDIAADSCIALAHLRDRFAAPDLEQPLESPGVPDVSVTVVICTRDRPESLSTTLASLTGQSDSSFEVVVVDNSPDGAVAHTLSGFEDLTVRCSHEPVPGLSRARNRGLSEVRTEFVAWIDDDEVADPDWVAWIKRGFASVDRPDVIAGVMLPAELETAAQVNFERYGGFNKGRGIKPVPLLAGTPSVSDPLLPLPIFGSGGNMAFRTETLRAIGGFDNRLGAGTLTRGGEDTRALCLALESGSMILYWPPAITWHYHRRTDEALATQFFGNSAGLTAFYMSLILTSPKYVWRILRFVPLGVKRILANHGSGEPNWPTGGVPENLLRESRKGLLLGAWLYLREVRRQRRAEPCVECPERLSHAAELVLTPAQMSSDPTE